MPDCTETATGKHQA